MGNFIKKSRHATTFEEMVKENKLSHENKIQTHDAGFGKCDKCRDETELTLVNTTPLAKEPTMRKLCFKCIMNSRTNIGEV